MRKLSLFITLCLIQLTQSACSSPVSRYVYDRFADAADVGRANLGLGSPGLGMDVQLTRYVRGAFGGYQDQNKMGFLGRKGGFWVEDKSILAFGKTYRYYLRRKNVVGNIQDSNIELLHLLSGPPEMQKLSPPWLFDISLYVFFIGAELGLDPFEAVDFILGWLTIDIADDDILRRPDPGKTYMQKLKQTGYGKKTPPSPPIPTFNKGISPIPSPPYANKKPGVNQKKSSGKSSIRLDF